MQGPSQDSDDEAIASINIIPLVDVVLVLLIIFMVTTVFARDSSLDLKLPTGSRPSENMAPPAEITVSVDKNEHILVNGKPTELKSLQQHILSLRSTDRKTVLVLRGDRTVLYGTIMPVLDEISRTGIDLTLALEAPRAGPK